MANSVKRSIGFFYRKKGAKSQVDLISISCRSGRSRRLGAESVAQDFKGLFRGYEPDKVDNS